MFHTHIFFLNNVNFLDTTAPTTNNIFFFLYYSMIYISFEYDKTN